MLRFEEAIGRGKKEKKKEKRKEKSVKMSRPRIVL